MIPFNFRYIIPETIKEAVQAWTNESEKGEIPVYYSGGTEIITLCRNMKIKPGAVIDIKKISECNIFSEGTVFQYGAALSLNKIAEKTKLTILGKTLTGIADHTIRNKITLGGNIMGRLPYREAILPFLIMDGKIDIASSKGLRTENISDFFDKRMILGNGELLVNLSLSNLSKEEKWFFRRKEKDGRIDYPILTVCFAGIPGKTKMAVSGAFSYPLRSIEAETILNNVSLPAKERAYLTSEQFNNLYRTDFRASAEYRKHLLKLAISEALEYMENDDEHI